MKFKGTSALAAAMLTGSGSAYADQPTPAVVAVHYVVNEQLAEHLEKSVLDPLERTCIALPRVSRVTSTASDGYVDLEVQFEGGASEQDRETVSRRVEELAAEVAATSRTVRLASPRL